MAEPEAIDLLNDEYWLVTWPNFALHSDKFPYLVYRLAGGIYAPVKVPNKYNDQLALLEWAQKQVELYQREACLILSPKHCYYIHSPNKIVESNIPAMGGTVVNFGKWQNREIEEEKAAMPMPVTIFKTNNRNSEIPSVVTTNERFPIEGLGPGKMAN